MTDEAMLALAEAIQAGALLALPTKPTEEDRQATYIAALAYGLSDVEARAEGWPRRSTLIQGEPGRDDDGPED